MCTYGHELLAEEACIYLVPCHMWEKRIKLILHVFGAPRPYLSPRSQTHIPQHFNHGLLIIRSCDQMSCSCHHRHRAEGSGMLLLLKVLEKKVMLELLVKVLGDGVLLLLVGLGCKLNLMLLILLQVLILEKSSVLDICCRLGV